MWHHKTSWLVVIYILYPHPNPRKKDEKKIYKTIKHPLNTFLKSRSTLNPLRSPFWPVPSEEAATLWAKKIRQRGYNIQHNTKMMLLSDATLMLPFYPFLHLVNPPRVCSFRFFFPFDTTKNARCFIDALWCAIWWHLVLREHVTFKHATAAWASNAVLFTHMANTHTTVAPASPAIVASQLATYSNKHRWAEMPLTWLVAPDRHESNSVHFSEL